MTDTAPESRTPPGRTAALWIALPIALAFGLLTPFFAFAAGQTLVMSLLAGVLAFCAVGFHVGVILGIIGLVQVLSATRGGAESYDPDAAARGFPLEVDLGGSRASAWERARGAVLALSAAKVLAEDADGGTLRVQADGRRQGAKCLHTVNLRLEGTVAHVVVRHDDANRPFELGSTRKQADALEAALRGLVQPVSAADAATEKLDEAARAIRARAAEEAGRT